MDKKNLFIFMFFFLGKMEINFPKCQSPNIRNQFVIDQGTDKNKKMYGCTAGRCPNLVRDIVYEPEVRDNLDTENLSTEM